MKNKSAVRHLMSALSFAALLLAASFANGQNHPHMFRQPPAPTQPGRHAVVAQIGDIDTALLSSAPEGLTIAVPGKPDLSIQRHSFTRRGPANLVWRGNMAGDNKSSTTLTFQDGMLFGRIENGNEIYSIHPGANGRTVIEKIDSNSFAPEWGHDRATHGHERVPPAPSGGAPQGGSSSSATVNATADGTVEIVLMSVYTPQARAAAGGTPQIQGQIQAAVDQANTAFINSNMIARYFLGHAEEVAYNDTGDMNADLNWVTGNASVASLRNTYGADMISLIVENGGAYCGIGWVQRHPGSSFASYAFQVTDRGCLTNSTLAHEHGHNLGMEHNPENSDVGTTPSSASYPWSFGHWVNGQFATVMTYNSICPSYCPRILNFSNPDVLYNGFPTGILNQRDNAQTGDSTAPIVAAFRAGGGSGVNNPPVFTSDPIVKPNATQGTAYAGSLSSNASDPNGDPLSFAKTAGPAWLAMSANGSLSGTPGAGDVGLNTFNVTVSDGRGGTAAATLQITVIATLPAPTNLVATAGVKQINLTWSFSGSGISGFKIESSTNGKSYAQIATVGAISASYLNTGLRSGRKYYYRVRAYSASSNSAYSNVATATAK